MLANINKHRVVAAGLALWILVTSIGVTMDVHYCRGHILSFSVFGKAKDCSKLSVQTKMNKCPHFRKMMAQHGRCPVDEKKNCHHKTLRFQFDKDRDVQKIGAVFLPQLKGFFVSFAFQYVLDKFSMVSDLPTFIHYRPPNIRYDYSVLFQSFLL